MTLILCTKLKKQAESLETAPFPGPLGEKIHKEISAEAWKLWLAHQTILINEYRLNVIDPKSRQFLREELEKFLFGEGSEKPSQYTSF